MLYVIERPFRQMTATNFAQLQKQTWLQRNHPLWQGQQKDLATDQRASRSSGPA